MFNLNYEKVTKNRLKTLSEQMKTKGYTGHESKQRNSNRSTQRQRYYSHYLMMLQTAFLQIVTLRLPLMRAQPAARLEMLLRSALPIRRFKLLFFPGCWLYVSNEQGNTLSAWYLTPYCLSKLLKLHPYKERIS